MPRFVLLEHRRDGVHWDFMLEAGEVLRTWALAEPVVAGVESPARALADHRLHYLDHEGEIAGGRGTVRRVDRGEYAVKLWTADRVRVVLAGVQLAGEADLWRAGSGPAETPSLNWLFRFGNLD